jgi:cobalamin biosynthesis protein CobC
MGMNDRATSTRATEPEAVVHGGNLDEIGRRYPDAPRPWIDLSTGINPIAYPVPALATEAWSRLPRAADERALLATAAARYGVRSPASIVAAAGTQALLQIIPRLRGPSSVAVLGPTYEEHALSWRRCGHRVRLVGQVDALVDADVAVVVNPNNPTGRLLSRETLTSLASRLAHRNGLLVVDEAFADFLPPESSLASDLPPATLVLRSFGKTYGLAGLRLGFALASADLAAPLRASLGAWPVSGPAIDIGRRALADDAWLEETRLRLERDYQRLQRLLVDHGFQTIGGASLFHLARHERARDIFAELLRQGILCRPFAAFPDRLRFGIPAGPEGWRRLELALRTK